MACFDPLGTDPMIIIILKINSTEKNGVCQSKRRFTII